MAIIRELQGSFGKYSTIILESCPNFKKNNVYGLEVFQKFEKKKDYSRLLD